MPLMQGITSLCLNLYGHRKIEPANGNRRGERSRVSFETFHSRHRAPTKNAPGPEPRGVVFIHRNALENSGEFFADNFSHAHGGRSAAELFFQGVEVFEHRRALRGTAHQRIHDGD